MCTVILKVRNLETSVVALQPKKIVMESDTVLTQYVIMNWYDVSAKEVEKIPCLQDTRLHQPRRF